MRATPKEETPSGHRRKACGGRSGRTEYAASKSKTVWTWLLTTIGAPLAAFDNLDWCVQLVIVGFAVYGIKRRADLAKAVRYLTAELG